MNKDIGHITVLPFMSTILGHVATELIVEMMAGGSSRCGGTGSNTGRITTLNDVHIRWYDDTIDRLILRAVLHRQFGAFLVVRITAVHATVAHWTPEQFRTMIAVGGRRVRMFLETMRMEELVLIARQPPFHNDLQCGTFML